MVGVVASTLVLACSASVPEPDRSEVFNLISSFPFASIESSEGSESDNDFRAEVDDEVLSIPSGAQVHYYLRVPEKAVLRVKDVQFRGGPGTRVVIRAQRDGQDPRELLDTARPGPIVADLGDFAGQPTRLSLSAVSAEPQTEASSIRLSRPGIWAPAEPEGKRPVQPVRDAAPNVLVYLIDTLRPDHLGGYGYDRPVSPAIDSLATDGGVLFENVIAHSSWTKPAVASVLTGLWPRSHGAVGRGGRIPGNIQTMAEVLQMAGYQTAAFATNPNVSRGFGFQQGFDELHSLESDVTSHELNELVFEWVRKRSRTKPFFLYLHSMDVHPPYLAHPELQERIDPTLESDAANQMAELVGRLHKHEIVPVTPDQQRRLVSLYDTQIAFNDRSFGQLLDFLRREELYEKTLIVLVSDHGEEFREHGAWGHRNNLHAAATQVALIMRFPDSVSPLRIEERVQQIDIMPTILDYLSLTAPPTLEGRTLLPLAQHGVREPEAWSRRPAFLQLRSGTHRDVAVVQEGWKLLVRFRKQKAARTWLYNLAVDSGETVDVSSTYPVRAAYLFSLIEQIEARGHPAADNMKTEISEELRKRLRALGYVD